MGGGGEGSRAGKGRGVASDRGALLQRPVPSNKSRALANEGRAVGMEYSVGK